MVVVAAANTIPMAVAAAVVDQGTAAAAEVVGWDVDVAAVDLAFHEEYVHQTQAVAVVHAAY